VHEDAPYTWIPTREQLDGANVTRLARRLDCADYDELHRLSLDEPERFWRAVQDDLGVPFFDDWDRVLDDSHGSAWTT
jgi:acetyl-CoA synthetase